MVAPPPIPYNLTAGQALSRISGNSMRGACPATYPRQSDSRGKTRHQFPVPHSDRSLDGSISLVLARLQRGFLYFTGCAINLLQG